MRSIGIRELRQNASEHVRAVQQGEELVVTDRGRPVARLVGFSPLEARLQHLVEKHGLIPPRAPFAGLSTSDLVPGPPMSDDVQEGRQDRDLGRDPA